MYSTFQLRLQVNQDNRAGINSDKLIKYFVKHNTGIWHENGLSDSELQNGNLENNCTKVSQVVENISRWRGSLRRHGEIDPCVAPRRRNPCAVITLDPVEATAAMKQGSFRTADFLLGISRLDDVTLSKKARIRGRRTGGNTFTICPGGFLVPKSVTKHSA